jgi:hypothetical protein
MSDSNIDYELLIAASRQAKEFLDNYGVPPSEEESQELLQMRDDFIQKHNLQNDFVSKIYSSILQGKEPPEIDSLSSSNSQKNINSTTSSEPSPELVH